MLQSLRCIFFYNLMLHLIFNNSFQMQEENNNLFNWFDRKLSFWIHHHDQPIMMKIKTFKYLIKYQITIGGHYTPFNEHYYRVCDIYAWFCGLMCIEWLQAGQLSLACVHGGIKYLAIFVLDIHTMAYFHTWIF